MDVRRTLAALLPEVVQVGDLLHAQPAELRAANGARHVVARAVVHLDDEGAAARARLDVACRGAAPVSEQARRAQYTSQRHNCPEQF